MGNEIAANKPENPSYPQDVVDKTSRTVDKCITCNKVVTLLVAVGPRCLRRPKTTNRKKKETTKKTKN
ncbi:MAG: hypothetical protein ACR2N0_00955, partial [Rubrobacteraceae bacterium]